MQPDFKFREVKMPGAWASLPDGTPQRVIVRNAESDTITIDLNHPLTGISLNFDVEIVTVCEPTEDEIPHYAPSRPSSGASH